MQAKHLRICRQGQSLDEVQVGGVVAVRWCPIQARRAEIVVWVEDGWGVEEGQNGGKRATIVGVCNSATIVALPGQVCQGLNKIASHFLF